MKTRNILMGAAGALMLATAAYGLAPAIAAPSDVPPASPSAVAPPPPPPGGPGDRWSREDRGPRFGGQDWRRGPGWRHSAGDFRQRHALRIAQRLSEQETLIGIRSNQLDAWRDYTDAFLALAAPPRMEGHPDRSEPFSNSQALADRAIKRGDAGEKLKTAIEKLKGVLTPEQLERMADASRDGMGRGGRPGFDRGPGGDRGPGRGPDKMDGPGRL